MKKYLITIIAMLSLTFSYSQVKVFTGGVTSIGGTSTPINSNKLQIFGNTIFSTASSAGSNSSALIRSSNGYSSYSSPDYTFNGDNTTGIFHPAARRIGFSIYGSEKMRIDSTGNVGVNSNTPPVRFTVNGEKSNKTGISVKSWDVDLLLTEDSLTNGGKIQVMSGGSASTIGTTPYHLLLQPQGGNVGIGLNNPNNIIQVKDYINFNPTYYGTFLGYQAGNSTTGTSNVAIGYQALLSCTTGYKNTVIGAFALKMNTTGCNNTATGYGALNANTGSENTAFGYCAMIYNTSGIRNTAIGNNVLFSCTTGSYNTGSGFNALYSNTSGYMNTAVGYYALYNNTIGYYNTTIGYGADVSANNLNNATAIGFSAIVNANNKIRLGNANVQVIEGQVAYTYPSDGRFKFNITEEVKGLEFIKKLRPIMYQMNTQQFDNFLIQNMPDSIKVIHQTGMNFAPSTAIIHSGFIAQEVDSIAQLIGYNFDGVHKPQDANDNYSLAYSQFVVPLVKAVQELSKTIDSLKNHLKTADSLLAVLQNCCLSGATHRTMQNSNEDQGGLQNNEIKQNNNDFPKLYQNTPNPFNSKTEIKYYVPENSIRSAILIFDMQGKLLKTNNLMNKGNGSLEIFGGELKPGMYMYSLIIDDKEIDTKKMILTE